MNNQFEEKNALMENLIACTNSDNYKIRAAAYTALGNFVDIDEVLYLSLIHIWAKSAGIIMGAKAPIVLVSRADTHESKLYSIAYGAIVAAHKK